MSNYQAYENGANLILRPILAESVNTKREYQSWMSFLYFVLSNCHWRGKIEPQEELDYRNIEVLTHTASYFSTITHKPNKRILTKLQLHYQ